MGNYSKYKKNYKKRKRKKRAGKYLLFAAAVVFVYIACRWLLLNYVYDDGPQNTPSHNLVPASASASELPQTPEAPPASEPQTPDSVVSQQPGHSETSEATGLRVVFLDVGEGDACLVTCDGHSMLIDGGPSSTSQLMYTVLKNEGIDHLDCIVATHPDADHIGGLSGALSYAKADAAYGTGQEKDTKAYKNLMKKLFEQNLVLTVPGPGDQFSLGSATVTVLGPGKGVVYSDNTSIVLKICYGETSFLFTGDSEREDEAYLTDCGIDLKSTVLKIGHHGSNSSTTKAFLAKVKPEYAVISVGKDSSYGHPTQPVLDRIKAAGCQLYRTDLQGSITCVSDGKTVTFTTEKNAAEDIFIGYAETDFNSPALIEHCINRVQ